MIDAVLQAIEGAELLCIGVTGTVAPSGTIQDIRCSITRVTSQKILGSSKRVFVKDSSKPFMDRLDLYHLVRGATAASMLIRDVERCVSRQRVAKGEAFSIETLVSPSFLRSEG